MSEEHQTFRTEVFVLGALLGLGLIIAAWILGAEIKAIRLGDRYVTVKGLVERTVKSDLAIWTLDYKTTGDVIGEVYSKTEENKQIVLQFLKEQGMQPSEIGLGIIRVVDTQANEDGGDHAQHRYIAEQQITVRTARVDQVAAAAQKTIELLHKGVVLSSNPGAEQGISYKFNSLNAIKPDMITEATRNARAAANRFAEDSGSRVGSIRQANQGVFSILPADETAESDNDNSQSDNSSLMKKVRVVTSVEYYLEK